MRITNKIDSKEVRSEDIDWILLLQDKVQRLDIVITEMKPRVPK